MDTVYVLYRRDDEIDINTCISTDVDKVLGSIDKYGRMDQTIELWIDGKLYFEVYSDRVEDEWSISFELEDFEWKSRVTQGIDKDKIETIISELRLKLNIEE